MINWIKKNRDGIIRGMFLVPIVLVMIISISHVVSWYDLSNPVSWAIYLSIAVEIAAMSSIAAASVKIKGGVWFVFAIVTLIQFIGNIFFSYKDIDVTSQGFKDWVELTQPVFDALGSDTSDMVVQRRWLSLLSGGLLPLISLASLHFFIKYDGKDGNENITKNDDPKINPPMPDEPQGESPEVEQVTEQVTEQVVDSIEETPQDEVKNEESTGQESNDKIEEEKEKTTLEDAVRINLKKKADGTDKWA